VGQFGFCRVHKTLRMEAGLAKHIWEISELVEMMEQKSILDGLTQTA